ncbi:NTP transferase domain-containing protein [Guyparkeria halophila]|uniref:Molybdenum cofactor guanylyltransferase n=1 Tax=Guyparkeria halophila TaxID=47960 RepID=A0ABZ0YZ06_9GAMM|nr:NTP transferase domain-containing protein [Guyparkeria halophila]WQH17271.1 NTP transferase domain-containing protein [Guyparkeria halophila]
MNDLSLQPETKLSALVLAGGASRRMDGRDKGLEPFLGQPMVSHVIESLAPSVDELVIVANRNLEAYRRLGHTTIRDPGGIRRGPAAAVHAANARLRHDWVLLAPCDMPRYRALWPARLVARQRATGAPVVIAHDGERLQPGIALFHGPTLRQDLVGPVPSRLTDLLTGGPHACCDLADDREAFLNVNTPTELFQSVAMPDMGRTRP